jgi:hypothetical protein
MRLTIAGGIFVFSLIFLLQPVSSETLDYIYIDSSVDEAAGGHAAIRLGESVFHFQYYDDGLFLLEKDHWEDFYHQYSNLQNRTISISRVPVTADTFSRIKNRFLTRFLFQERRVRYRQQLDAYQRFLEKAQQSGIFVIPIKGLGLFDDSLHHDHIGKGLAHRLEEELGTDFLLKRAQALEEEIQQYLFKIDAFEMPSGAMDLYRPWGSHPPFIQETQQKHALYQAVAVLQNELSLKKDLIITLDDNDVHLSERKIATLKQYREFFFSSIVRLLKSQRSDSGEPLLLQIARYHAVEHSIQQRKLYTLYPFSQTHHIIPVENLRSIKLHAREGSETKSGDLSSYFHQLQNAWQDQYRVAENFFFTTPDISEVSYNLLETTQGKVWEILRAKRDDDFLRIEEGYLLPGQIGYVEALKSITPEELQKHSGDVTALANVYSTWFQHTYSYSLFYKNCVTELFATINSAFPSQESIKNGLGGYIAPDDGFTFVPFESFNVFLNTFPAATIEVLPSYRKRYLQRMEADFSLLDYAREAATLTSTVYSPWMQDSVFLFFTDDTTMLRPLYGSMNILYGALGSVAGILTSPLDQGTLLKRAAKGILFSLPELLFVNIRKGTFPSIPTSEARQ